MSNGPATLSVLTELRLLEWLAFAMPSSDQVYAVVYWEGDRVSLEVLER